MSNIIQNYMEQAVLVEAQLALEKIAPTMKSVVYLSDIAALALNQLPPLYATSQEGLEHLKRKHQLDLRYIVKQTTRRSVITVISSPFRASVPLREEVSSEEKSISHCWELLQQKQSEIDCLRSLIMQHCPNVLSEFAILAASEMPFSTSRKYSDWSHPA